LGIRDNCSGMSEDAVRKVMDPFFTTKTVRSVRGSGTSNACPGGRGGGRQDHYRVEGR
jgi:signal transduction histidine kinase